MTHRPRPARALLGLLVAAGAMAATISLDAQSAQRSVYVSVTDQAGNPLANLAPSDFVVREDKLAREVLSVSPADDPMQIALMIDNSQASEPYLRDYREALTAFITAIASDTTARSKHQIALIALASRPTILKDYTSDQAALLKSALSIFSMSGTGEYLLDGILETSQGISKRGSPRPVIVAITTQGLELSDRPFETVLQPLRKSGAALHVVAVGGEMNMSHDRAVVIDEGSRTTGGLNENLLSSTALTNMMKRLATDLTHQYRVTYARPPTLIPPETVTVSVAKPGVTVRSTVVKEDRAQERR